jgi:lysozyme family protein
VTLEAEGGYVNDPDDPGGETNAGVTLGTWKTWLKKTDQKETRPLRSITKDDERKLYHDLYWDPHLLDRVTPAFAAVIFDAAVNLREGVAVRLAQAALMFAGAYEGPLDGQMSDATVAALNANPRAALFAVQARIGYHVARTNPKFVHGIVSNRLTKLRDLVARYLASPEEPPVSPSASDKTIQQGRISRDSTGRQHVTFRPQGP